MAGREGQEGAEFAHRCRKLAYRGERVEAELRTGGRSACPAQRLLSHVLLFVSMSNLGDVKIAPVRTIRGFPFLSIVARSMQARRTRCLVPIACVASSESEQHTSPKKQQLLCWTEKFIPKIFVARRRRRRSKANAAAARSLCNSPLMALSCRSLVGCSRLGAENDRLKKGWPSPPSR